MSHPQAVFLDTCILESQQFNFAGAALSSFLPEAKKRSLKLLLPDPTEKEIERHIRERSNEALVALENARRKAPFLAKWKGFPPKATFAEVEVAGIARGEWWSFLKQVETIRLGYDGVRTETVMDWYNRASAPFGKGGKRKEFPDAFAIAILAAYAAREKVTVAVVSTDNDMKCACGRYANLLHFSSLQRFTEALLKDQTAVERTREIVFSGLDKLEAMIKRHGVELSVGHARDYVVEDSRFGSASVTDFRIVAMGENECTLTFEAEIDVEADLRYTFQCGPDEDEVDEAYDRVNDCVVVEGTAKVKLNPDGSAVAEIPFLKMDDTDVVITEIPERFHR